MPSVRERPHAVDRRVQVDGAELVVGALDEVVAAELRPAGESVLDAERRARDLRHHHVRRDPRHRGRQLRHAGQVDGGVGRVADDHVALVLAVETQRLLVEAVLVPVVEDAEAAADRRAAALERRPREAGARRQVDVVVQVRLRLVAEAVAHEQVLLDAEVVLQVGAELERPVFDQRIADALRELQRLLGQIRVVRGERVGAVEVPRLVAAVRAAFDEHAGTERVLLAEGEVEVVGELDGLRLASAGDLRAAARERLLDVDRPGVAERASRPSRSSRPRGGPRCASCGTPDRWSRCGTRCRGRTDRRRARRARSRRRRAGPGRCCCASTRRAASGSC